MKPGTIIEFIPRGKPVLGLFIRMYKYDTIKYMEVYVPSLNPKLDGWPEHFITRKKVIYEP